MLFEWFSVVFSLVSQSFLLRDACRIYDSEEIKTKLLIHSY